MCHGSGTLQFYGNILIMKKISLWASQHVWQARLLIAVLHVVLITLALTMGILMYMEDIRVPGRVMVITQVVAVLAFILYPVRKRAGYLIRYSYRMQKRFDIVLLLCGAVLFAGWSNHLAFEPLARHQITPHARTVVHRTDMPSASKDRRQERKELRSQLRTWKEEIKQELKSIKNYRLRHHEVKRQGFGLKTLGMLGVILAGIVALRWISALSCSLSCSGYGAAGALVFIVGIIAIVLISVLAIRLIEGQRRQSIPEPVPDDIQTPPSGPTQ